jgi:hypothetical protein
MPAKVRMNREKTTSRRSAVAIKRAADAASVFADFLKAGELVRFTNTRRISRSALMESVNTFERVYRSVQRQLPGRCHANIDGICSGIRSEMRDESSREFVELGVYCIDRARLAHDLLSSYAVQSADCCLQVEPNSLAGRRRG